MDELHDDTKAHDDDPFIPDYTTARDRLARHFRSQSENAAACRRSPEFIELSEQRKAADAHRRWAEHRYQLENARRTLTGRMGARYAPDKVALDQFQVYHPAQKPVLERVREIVGGIRGFVLAGRGVVFIGDVGTGKDHLLAALLFAALEAELTVDFVKGMALFERLRATMREGAAETESKIIEEFVRPDVLGISDPLPPSGELSDWRRDVLTRILDKRYSAMRPTWVTVNAVSIEEADASMGPPAWDRLQHDAEIITCAWPSWRERSRKTG